jgi:phospholipase D1/2
MNGNGENRSESRSPRSSSPAPLTPTNTRLETTIKPSVLRSELASDDIYEPFQTFRHSQISKLEKADTTPTPIAPGDDPTNEAYDYINGGLPHENSKRLESNGNGNGNGHVAKYAPAPSTPSLRDNPCTTPAIIPGFNGGNAGISTPPGRRSVQFARQDGMPNPLPSREREDSWADGEEDTPARDRKAGSSSLMSKLKALATTSGLQTHMRSYSTGGIWEPSTAGMSSAPHSPTQERSARLRRPHTLEEEGSDADAEQTADERVSDDATRERKKRRTRRPVWNGLQTAPTTPARGMSSNDSTLGMGNQFFNPMRRRNTMPDGEEQRGGVSEGEGRDRLSGRSAWRRGSSWIGGARGQSFGGNPNEATTPSGRRPISFRRFTGLGPGSEDDAHTPRRQFLSGGDRAATYGANKWKMLKHGLKMLGTKKEEHKIDYMKSAELMAELRAGAPAALMLASMIQRDENGNKRIPVLLEQVKLHVTDSKANDEKRDDERERHLIFRIELEYGSGSNRMKWVISRSLGDFVRLHVRYKLQGRADKYLIRGLENRPTQPHFPRSSFPWLRNLRALGFDSDEEDEAGDHRADDTAGEATHSDADRSGVKKKKARPGFGHRRKSSLVFGDTASAITSMGEEASAIAAINSKKAFIEKQRKKLETYLQEMIRWLIFRADSNRLCRFLELSALGVRLAAEGSYHGKEGHLVIGSSKGIDFRRILTPMAIFRRHTPKWFLVRHSYIVCVDSPENMHVYDVFLLDPKFEIQAKRRKFKESIKDTKAMDLAMKARTSAAYPQHHRLKLRNSDRRVELLAKTERQLRQFEESIEFMMENSLWSKPNRFDSFAPVRHGVYAQWLVDGRDYMWNVSRAINMAKDVIYIHDWWLSPQLYMRRPAAISQKWRLDRLLRKKAREGVKIFIIIYRNVEAAVPIDSEFTKFSMLDLHPNVFVQRSPNQFKKNQFFFAHHEKICIVDHTVAFVGGIDLCFGRWDTPQHSVCDDKPTGFEPSDEPKDADHCQLWPGKDYSNPRVQDFYELSAPYAEMYDRSKTPRMPWHDVSMQVVGQPARDLTRHFVQRWNYVLRGRKPTRPTPFLLPPPDYNPAELEELGLNGTCEVQILRSASMWSLGVDETEHSIMNAYCKMIEESEHFVYMENQFFITSCETMNTKIVNKIGDAIVERAVRAYKNGENWRCVILIPLMPGFQNTVDAPDGTSVRLIMQCQFRSISRGEGSIFGRLRNEGIDPEDYVSFYSLRSWGKIGPKKALVTEQLYIHAKVIIVDDRIALIGSANINERSMLGSRDSECAAVVRDTDMIWSTMGGEPYLVGRFAHSLRMRLMREHLGLDVDEVMEEERRAELDREETEYEANMNRVYDDDSDYDVESPAEGPKRRREMPPGVLPRHVRPRSFNHDVDWEEEGNPNLMSGKHYLTTDERVINNLVHQQDVEGGGKDNLQYAEKTGFVRGRDSTLIDGVREVLVTDTAPEGKGTIESPTRRHPRTSITSSIPVIDASSQGNLNLPPPPIFRQNTEQLGLSQLSQLPALPIVDDTDIGGPPARRGTNDDVPVFETYNPLTADIKCPVVNKDCMRDPLNDTFFDDTWQIIAENNTKIFRRVFRCNPDNEVTNWHEYTEFQAYTERFAAAQHGKSEARQQEEAKGKSGPPGARSAIPQFGVVGDGLTKVAEKITLEHSGELDGGVKEWAEKAERENEKRVDTKDLHSHDGVDEKAAIKCENGSNGNGSNNNHNTLSPPTIPSTETTHPFSSATNLSPGAIESQSHTPSKSPSNPAKPSSPPNTSSQPQTQTQPQSQSQQSKPAPIQGSVRRRKRGNTRSKKGFSASDDLLSREQAEELLGLVQGSLVVFPTEWLRTEEHNSNWLYQVDMVAPLQI